MLLSIDVQYDSSVRSAVVGFAHWADATSMLEHVVRDARAPAPYEPGSFFKRELPSLVHAIEQVRARHVVTTVVIDAHVWLDAGRPGLGAHLAAALGSISVVGVAKSAYRDGIAIAILRGQSKSPLFITAVGIEPHDAANLVREMHGPFRIPTLLKRADQLARGHVAPDPSKAL